MSAGSVQLLRHKTEPTAIIVALLVLADLVILGAAVSGARGVLLLAAASVFFLFAFRAEWAMALMMVGYAWVVTLAAHTQAEGFVPFALRGLVLAALVLALLGRGRGSLADFVQRILRHPPLWIAFLFAAVLWIGTLHTGAGLYGTSKATGFTIAGLFYVSILAVIGWVWGHEEGELRGPRRFLTAVWAFLCLVALLAILNYIFRFDEYESRLGVPGLGPIWLSRMMGVGILMVPYVIHRLGVRRLPAILAAVLFGFIIILTGSRGPLFALFVTILAAVADRWLRRERRRQGRSDELILVGVLVLGGLGFLMLPEGITDRFFSLGADRPIMEGFSWKARLIYWGGAVMLFPDVGLAGLGTGGYPEALFHEDFRLYPHNVLLEVFLENGWPGLILLVLFVFVCWRTALRLRRNPSVAPEAGVAMFLGLFAFGNAMVSGDLIVNVGYWLWGGFLGALAIAASIRGDLRPVGVSSSSGQ